MAKVIENKNLFLLIDFKIFNIISLNVNTSGPIHSIVSPVNFFLYNFKNYI